MRKTLSTIMAFLVIVTTLISIFSFSASAATIGKTYNVVNRVERSTKARVTYNTEYYTIENGKTIKLDAFFGNDLIGVYKSNGVKLSRSNLLKQVRFDIHVYDQKGRCVNYKYGICDNGSFKVISNVKGIKQSEYRVKVTAYISSYKTLVLRSGDDANLAMSLKYIIK